MLYLEFLNSTHFCADLALSSFWRLKTPLLLRLLPEDARQLRVQAAGGPAASGPRGLWAPRAARRLLLTPPTPTPAPASAFERFLQCVMFPFAFSPSNFPILLSHSSGGGQRAGRPLGGPIPTSRRGPLWPSVPGPGAERRAPLPPGHPRGGVEVRTRAHS